MGGHGVISVCLGFMVGGTRTRSMNELPKTLSQTASGAEGSLHLNTHQLPVGMLLCTLGMKVGTLAPVTADMTLSERLQEFQAINRNRLARLYIPLKLVKINPTHLIFWPASQPFSTSLWSGIMRNFPVFQSRNCGGEYRGQVQRNNLGSEAWEKENWMVASLDRHKERLLEHQK